MLRHTLCELDVLAKCKLFYAFVITNFVQLLDGVDQELGFTEPNIGVMVDIANVASLTLVWAGSTILQR